MKKVLLASLIVTSFATVEAKLCVFCKNDNLDTIIGTNSKVVVDFYSPNCPPCRRLLPLIEKLGQETSDVVFVEVNVLDFPYLASHYHVSSIPHLAFFKDGKQKPSEIGYQSESALRNLIKSKLS
jgi:thioredoxin 1